MFNAYYNFLLEFSYWPIFSQQVYSFIVGMYFLDIFIAMGLESLLCESLLIAPIDVCINVIENTMTMGAASFVDFMVSFMVGLSITMIDRLYLGPAVDTVTTLIPRWKMMFRAHILRPPAAGNRRHSTTLLCTILQPQDRRKQKVVLP